MSNKRQTMFIGDCFESVRYGKFIVVDYISCDEVIIQFSDGTLAKSNCGNIRKGKVRNPNHKGLYGVGYVGEGDFKPSLGRKNTKEYNAWNNMFDRVYSEIEIRKNPKRLNSKIDDNWHCFQNFAKWCNEQPSWGLEGWVLDKDILVKGNVDYGPDVSCFIPARLNTIIAHQDLKLEILSDGYAYQARDILGKNKLTRGFSSEEDAMKFFAESKKMIVRTIVQDVKEYLPTHVFEKLMKWEVCL